MVTDLSAAQVKKATSGLYQRVCKRRVYLKAIGFHTCNDAATSDSADSSFLRPTNRYLKRSSLMRSIQALEFLNNVTRFVAQYTRLARELDKEAIR
jgi:hypothetical protein